MDNKTVLLTWSEPDKLTISIGGWDLQERPCGVEEVKYLLQNIHCLEPIPQWIYDLLDMVADDEVPEWGVDVRVRECTEFSYLDSTLNSLS